MGLSHWVDAAHRDAYWQAYDESLTLWPVPYTTTRVKTPQGSTHVVVSGATSGAPIVLLPAASLSATQWYAQAGELGRRFRLFAVDIVGDIGRSTQTDAIHSRADAAAWLTALLDGLGLERATLIGSSFGGFLSANLAVLRPARVGALVLLAPAATLQPFSLAAKTFIRLGSLVPLPSTVRPGLRAMMGGHLPDDRIVRQMEAGVSGFRYDHAGLFPSELPDVELQQIRCPTLVLVGEAERIYDASAAIDRARAHIPGVTAEVIPGLGHLLGMQDAASTNTRIRTFLERHIDDSCAAPGGSAA